MINETGVTVKRGLPSARRKMAYEPVGGKRRGPPGTVARRMAAMAAEEEAKQESVIQKILFNLKILQSWECFCRWSRWV